MQEIDLASIGKRIAGLRIGQGLTQEQLGEVLGLTAKYISRIEHGNYALALVHFVNLGEIFHVSVDYLLTGKKDAALNTALQQIVQYGSPEEQELLLETLRRYGQLLKKKQEKDF